MKGRHTSFQRFGAGSHNPFGSVLNKYLRTSTNREGNIYKETATRAVSVWPYADSEKKEPDLGEEVFGCLSNGIGTEGYLEINIVNNDYESMDNNRRSRKDVEQYAMEPILRSWKTKDGVESDDYTLIAQENIPTNTCAKYPIKFSTNSTKSEEISVKAGAGFSGPYLYRPPKYGGTNKAQIYETTNKAITEDAIVNGVPVSSIDIPVETAHQILNCTKQISFTGSFSHESKRKTVKCNGSSSAQTTENSHFADGDICSYSWKATKRVTTYSCASKQESGAVVVSGDLKGSMSRYKEMTSLWSEDPVQLDLSANYYIGSNAEKALQYASITELSDCICTNYGDPSDCPDPYSIASAKLLGEREEVTELDAGCAVVPRLDGDLIRRDQGKNLVPTALEDERCQSSADGGIAAKYLYSIPTSQGGYSDIGYIPIGYKDYPSGPSLAAKYVSTLYDFVGDGKEEDVFEKKTNCGEYPRYYEIYRSPKAQPIATGLQLKRTGSDCGLFPGMVLYDAEQYPGQLKASQGIEPECSDYALQGKYGFPCEYSRQCYENDGYTENFLKFLLPSGSDMNKATSSCSVPYRLNILIGNYVNVNGVVAENQGLKYYSESPMPLSIYAKQGDVHKLNIGFMFTSDRNIQQSSSGGVINSPVYDLPVISTCKAWHETLQGNTVEAGTLTLQHEDWSQAIPLWANHDPKQKEECEGAYGELNWIAVAGPLVDYCGGPYKTAGPRIDCFEKKCVQSVKGTTVPFTPTPPVCCETLAANCCATGASYYQCGCGCGCNCRETRDGGYLDPCPPAGEPQPPGSVVTTGFPIGCYGTAQDLEELTTKLNITLTFERFTKTGGI
jgi:hypothetical protein